MIWQIPCIFWEMAGDPTKPFSFFPVPSTSTPLGKLGRAAELHASEGVGPTPRVFGERAAVLVIGGGGVYSDVAGKSYEITPGSMIHVFPDLAHIYGPTDGRQWNELYVCYEGAAFDELEKHSILNREFPVWQLEPLPYWERRLRTVLSQWSAGAGPISALQAVAQWLEFLAEAWTAGSTTLSDETWLIRIRQLLEKETRLPLSVPPERLAAICGLSYESLRKKFRQAMGCGLVEFHRQRIVERAEMLLDRTRLTHSQIADLLGFCDAFHFAKLFKRYSGKTPSEHRAERISRTEIES